METKTQSENEWRRSVMNRFIEQVKDFASELAEQGRDKESVDLLFRCGVVCGMAMKTISEDENANRICEAE